MAGGSGDEGSSREREDAQVDLSKGKGMAENPVCFWPVGPRFSDSDERVTLQLHGPMHLPPAPSNAEKMHETAE